MKNLQVGFGTWAIAAWTIFAFVGIILKDSIWAWPLSWSASGFLSFGFLMGGTLAASGARGRRGELARSRRIVSTVAESIGVVFLASCFLGLSFTLPEGWILWAMSITGLFAWGLAAFGKRTTTPAGISMIATSIVVAAGVCAFVLSGIFFGRFLIVGEPARTIQLWHYQGTDYRAVSESAYPTFGSNFTTVDVGRIFLIWAHENVNLLDCFSHADVPEPKVRFEAPNTIVVYDAGACAGALNGSGVETNGKRIRGKSPLGATAYGVSSYDGMNVVFQK